MILSRTAIKRPVMTTMFLLALVILGAMSYFSLPVNMFPDATVPIITVQVIYSGAGPDEIETNITKKIEDEVSTLSNLDYVQSYVMNNVSFTLVRFNMDKDIDIANQEVKDKVDAIVNEFPDDAEAPAVMKFDINADPIMDLSFTAELSPKEIYTYVDDNIKDRLARINGVAQVSLSGGQEREIHIILNNSKIRKYSLSPLQLMSYIQANNLNIPGGNIRKMGAEFSVKVEGEFKDIEEIKNIKIPTQYGEKKLSELADVVDGEKYIERIARYYDLQKGSSEISSTISAINISIQKQADANTIEVADAVKKEVKKINAELPKSQLLAVGRDGSTFVSDSVNDTISSIILGIILAGLVLYIFLHSMRNTLIVAITMPVALVATLLLVSFSGFSINMMSLMALSISVGTLVTNSVVILENINRYLDMGYNKVEAADHGTAEIAVAVIASTLTNVVVFLPIAMMESIVGQFFKEFGLTVTYTMIFSIIMGFTLTPMLAAKLLHNKKERDEEKSHHTKKNFGDKFDEAFEKLAAKYHQSLKYLFQHKKSTWSIPVLSIILLVLSFILIGGKIGNEFIPASDEGDIKITVEMPTYYEINHTNDIFMQIEKTIMSHKEVNSITTTVGIISDMDQGSNSGLIKIKLVDVKDRAITTEKFINALNEDFSSIPDAKIKISASSSTDQGHGGSPIEIEVLGTDLKEIEKITNAIYNIALETPGTINIDTDIREGKPEIKILPDRKKLSDYGLTVQELAMTIRANIEGVTISTYKDNGNEYDITLKTNDQDKNDPEKVKNLPILTKLGNVKLSELANIEFSSAPTKITRKNKFRLYSVSGDVLGRSIGDVVKDIQKEIDATVTIPEGYKVNFAGDAEMMGDAAKDFGKAFLLAIILTFMLIAAILESYLQATLIMFTLPLSIIGVLWSLFLTGQSQNIFSQMSVVMLIGIVVNNAILLLDYANHLRENKGYSKLDAILDACQTKLKAVIMSTLSIILGMLPLALGLGSGAELRQAMGIVSIGGLLVSSILTLYVIPTLYVLFAKEHRESHNIDEVSMDIDDKDLVEIK